jgi:hypothetical protein
MIVVDLASLVTNVEKAIEPILTSSPSETITKQPFLAFKI